MNPLMTYLDSIRDHLDLYDLPPVWDVEVSVLSEPVRVHLKGADLPEVAAGLLAWVDTLELVTASLWRTPSGESVHLSITGRLAGGVPVRVYAGADFSETVFPDLPTDTRQDMPVFVLRGWSDKGEEVAA
jgi:hypothetical protein